MRRAALLIGLLVGCGPGTDPMTGHDAAETFDVAVTATVVAYEGQSRLVTVLSAEGRTFDGAHVEVADPAGSLSIVDQLCRGSYCGVVLSVRDRRPNTGNVLPAPIDAENEYVDIRPTSGRPLRALFTVFPLDAFSVLAGSHSNGQGGLRLGASLTVENRGEFVAIPGADPVRWIIFGDAAIHGLIDASAQGQDGGPGGGDGGAPGSPGTGSGAGSAGNDATYSCSTLTRGIGCGGGGGGGGTSAGGGGGGALLIAALGAMDASGGMILARGAAAQAGSGSGAGGSVWVSGTTQNGTMPTLDVSGGGSAAAGDTVMAVAPAAHLAPAIDIASLTFLSQTASIMLAGSADPGVAVRVAGGSAPASATAGSDGRFQVSVSLSPGLNRLQLWSGSGASEVRSWTGTAVEFEHDTLTPLGAFVDVAYLP